MARVNLCVSPPKRNPIAGGNDSAGPLSAPNVVASAACARLPARVVCVAAIATAQRRPCLLSDDDPPFRAGMANLWWFARGYTRPWALRASSLLFLEEASCDE